MFDQDVPKSSGEGGNGELGLIIQDLVASGHSWSNIKQYTLSEIGVFIRSIYVAKERERIEKLSLGWMSSNLTHDGMLKTVKDMKDKSVAVEKTPVKTKEEVGKEWLRLASFQQR